MTILRARRKVKVNLSFEKREGSIFCFKDKVSACRVLSSFSKLIDFKAEIIHYLKSYKEKRYIVVMEKRSLAQKYTKLALSAIALYFSSCC